MKRNIVLTGAKGQLGMEWQRFFAKRGIEISALGSEDLDISNEDQVQQMFATLRPHYLINCAAYTAVDAAEESYDKAHAINAVGVKYLAQASAQFDTKLVHYSTDYVFSGAEKDRLTLPAGYPEHHPCDPINAYGTSKLAGEKLVREYCDNYMIIRVSWLCGRYGNNFVKTMLRLGSERDQLRVIDDQFGVPSFAENVVYNTSQLLKQDFKGIIHISSSGLTNWYEFAEMIFLQTGIDIEVIAIPSSAYPVAAKRPHYSKLDITKLKMTPDCSVISWNEGLEKLLFQIQKQSPGI